MLCRSIVTSFVDLVGAIDIAVVVADVVVVAVVVAVVVVVVFAVVVVAVVVVVNCCSLSLLLSLLLQLQPPLLLLSWILRQEVSGSADKTTKTSMYAITTKAKKTASVAPIATQVLTNRCSRVESSSAANSRNQLH